MTVEKMAQTREERLASMTPQSRRLAFDVVLTEVQRLQEIDTAFILEDLDRVNAEYPAEAWKLEEYRALLVLASEFVEASRVVLANVARTARDGA